MVVTPRLVVACWMRLAWNHQQSGLQRGRQRVRSARAMVRALQLMLRRHPTASHLLRQRVLEPSQQLEMAPVLGMEPSLPQALVSGKAHSQPLEPLLA